MFTRPIGHGLRLVAITVMTATFCAITSLTGVSPAKAELRPPVLGDYDGVVGRWELRDEKTLKLVGIFDVKDLESYEGFSVRLWPQVDLPGYRFIDSYKIAAAGGTHNLSFGTRIIRGPVKKTFNGYLYMGRIEEGRGKGLLSYLGRKPTKIVFHRHDLPAKAPPPATDAYASDVCKSTLRKRNAIFAELKSAGQGREKVNDILTQAGLPTNANQSGYTIGKCLAANQGLEAYLKELRKAARKPAIPMPQPPARPAPQAQLGPNCTAVQNAWALTVQQGTAQSQKRFRDLLKRVGLSPDNPVAEILCGVVLAQVQDIAGLVPRSVPATPQQPGSWVANSPKVAGSGWTPGPGGRSITLWKNDLGSTFAWQDNGSGRRVLWLWEAGPRDAIVNQRTVRFEGVKRGADVTGTSYFYYDGCGAFPYPVTGTVEAGPAVLLTGPRPQVDASCKVVGSTPQTMRYTFIANAPTAAVYEPPLDTPGVGVWGPSWQLHRLPRFETLNVRRGPGTAYAVLAELPETARDILVIGNGCTPNPDTESFTRATPDDQAQMVSRSWCNISWRSPVGKDVEGWVYGKYLRPAVR